MKVALCHQGFGRGDAIGNDMAGMYRMLVRIGMQPAIVCDWTSQAETFRIVKPEQADWKSFDLIIYHHSQYWQLGEELIDRVRCPIIFKYHNITPAYFFQPYSQKHYEICARGEHQTEMLLSGKSHAWLTDSEFNRTELIRAGADPNIVHVAPPFNRVRELLPLQHVADYRDGDVDLLFVGRVAPNKGHLHLLRVLFVLRHDFSRPVRLRVVGATDPSWDDYYSDISRHITEFGLEDQVEIRPHCPDAELVELYRRSHVYFCLSEHEGFNVPIIESQAIGLPIVGAAVAATGETAGPGQLFSDVPTSPEDDYFYAALIQEICTDESLRDQLTMEAEHNVRNRFTDEPIENAFVHTVFETIGHS